jgi:hypothetical protein
LAQFQVRGFILSPYPAASTIAFMLPQEYVSMTRVGGSTMR